MAVSLYNKYKNNVLGIISDISYPRNGEMDNEAGIELCKLIKKDNEYIPFLLQSAEEKYKKISEELGCGFINKNSKTISIELKDFIIKNFAFGDFVVIDPDTKKELMRASDLQDLQYKIFDIPDKSLYYHISNNHFSRWLNARALFPIAQVFKQVSADDFENMDEVRRFLYDTISAFRSNKGRGVIAKFYRDRFDEYFIFSRIGDGSLGGKARGLAFLDSMLKRNRLLDKFPGMIISIPRTVVLATDVFDEFMSENKLYKIALQDLDDSEILKHFVNARCPCVSMKICMHL